MIMIQEELERFLQPSLRLKGPAAHPLRPQEASPQALAAPGTSSKTAVHVPLKANTGLQPLSTASAAIPTSCSGFTVMRRRGFDHKLVQEQPGNKVAMAFARLQYFRCCSMVFKSLCMRSISFSFLRRWMSSLPVSAAWQRPHSSFEKSPHKQAAHALNEAVQARAQAEKDCGPIPCTMRATTHCLPAGAPVSSVNPFSPIPPNNREALPPGSNQMGLSKNQRPL